MSARVAMEAKRARMTTEAKRARETTMTVVDSHLSMNVLHTLKDKRTKHKAKYLNKHSMSFMPAIACTSTRIHDDLSCPLFPQADRETKEYFGLAPISQRDEQIK